MHAETAHCHCDGEQREYDHEEDAELVARKAHQHPRAGRPRDGAERDRTGEGGIDVTTWARRRPSSIERSTNG